MSYIERAILSKQLAADILLPLIEYEACFLGSEAVKLVQAERNREQIGQLYRVVSAHGWTTRTGLHQYRKGLWTFSLSKAGFGEIYSLSGPMSDKRKDDWAKLLVERTGQVGGWRKDKPSTRSRVSAMLQGTPGATVEEICLKLRLQPGVVNEALREL